MRTDSFEKAIEVTRGGMVESVHAAAIAVTDPAGRVLLALGDPAVEVVMRSAAKPFQAAAVVASGAMEKFGLTSSELALISGSHSGEEAHQATAASILSKAGLGVADLQCGVHTPFSQDLARELAREGRAPDPLMNNCSGKHAGMLAASRAGGHPVESYLHPGHPIQRASRDAIAEFTGRLSEEIALGVDGCSAPTFKVGLHELARGFARLVDPALSKGAPAMSLPGALARVAEAMRRYPEMVAGVGMLDTCLMRLLPGLVAKVGADGIHAMGWPSPRGPIGVALKIMDGDIGRARTAAVMSVLEQIGALTNGIRLPDALTRHRILKNHRKIEVGEVRAVFCLTQGS